MGNHVAVFRHCQQLVAAAFAGFSGRHFARRSAKRLMCRLTASSTMSIAFRNWSPCRSSSTVRLMRERRSATLARRPSRPFSSSSGKLTAVRVAGGHVAFGFDNAGFQQAFLLVGEHAVAAILHRLATPPWADFMQHALVLFAHRKARARTVRQVVNLFLNPRDGVFREDRRGAHFAGTVPDDQLVVLDPDGTLGGDAPAPERGAPGSACPCAAGTFRCNAGRARYRPAASRYARGRFVRLNALAEGVEIQGGHRFILVRSRLTLSGRRTAARSPAGQGYPAVCQGQSRVGRAGCICSCPACDTAENEYRGRRVHRQRSW